MGVDRDGGEIVGDVGSDQYEKHIQCLQSKGIDTTAIENAIKKTIESFNYDDNSSFVIFGEPQSGKTELMSMRTEHILTFTKP